MWNFIVGNFIDAVLYFLVGGLLLSSIGSILAVWSSFRDETKYEHRQKRITTDQQFADYLESNHKDAFDFAFIKNNIDRQIQTLLFLKHIAFKQVAKYSKYAIAYTVIFFLTLGIQSWHMNKEIQEHEPSAIEIEQIKQDEDGVKDNIKIVHKDSDTLTVAVQDKDMSALYEFVYADHNGELEKMYSQKTVQIPTLLMNIMAIIWLLMIWSMRYISRVI